MSACSSFVRVGALLDCLDEVADVDLSIAKNIGAEAPAVDQSAERPFGGEAF